MAPEAGEAPEFAAPDRQAARVELRSGFLRALQHLTGRHCNISMHDNTLVRGKFAGCDVDMQNILVSELSTAQGLVPSAILRASDIICITFTDPMLT